MATRKPQLYVNKFSGDITYATKVQAKQLSEDWTKVEFVPNEDGKPVMRMHLDGATVDVSENDKTELVEIDGDPEAE